MRIIVNGAGGRMGCVLCEMIENGHKHTLAARVSLEYETDREKGMYKSLEEFCGEADIIIDFSNHSATYAVTSYALNRRLPLVIATTGQSEQELEMIRAASEKIPLFYSQNMSLGVAVLSCLAKITAKAFPDCDIEIIEKHHNRKLDAPSGTAILLADSIKGVRQGCTYNMGRSGYGKREAKEIGIHAVRMGSEVGTHEIIFATDSQVITLTHKAENRGLFAEGALSAAEFLILQQSGFYNMDSILS